MKRLFLLIFIIFSTHIFSIDTYLMRISEKGTFEIYRQNKKIGWLTPAQHANVRTFNFYTDNTEFIQASAYIGTGGVNTMSDCEWCKISLREYKDNTYINYSVPFIIAKSTPLIIDNVQMDSKILGEKAFYQTIGYIAHSPPLFVSIYSQSGKKVAWALQTYPAEWILFIDTEAPSPQEIDLINPKLLFYTVAAHFTNSLFFGEHFDQCATMCSNDTYHSIKNILMFTVPSILITAGFGLFLFRFHRYRFIKKQKELLSHEILAPFMAPPV